MTADITLDSLTDTTIVTEGVANGTGVFDRLMNTVNLYLNDQYNEGRLKGTDYANVLLGSIQTVLAQSVQYALQEQLLEAQVDDIRKGVTLKEAQEKELYVERVIKDKQAALLGLDKGLINGNSSNKQ